jgi:hypothetical protein
MKLINAIGVILGGMFVIIVALFLGGIILSFPIMWLWNWLMPELFDLQTIGYWQSFGLFYLSGLLFRSFTATKNND